MCLLQSWPKRNKHHTVASEAAGSDVCDSSSHHYTGYADLFKQAAKRLEDLGGTCVTDFDFSLFAATAAMLYETAFIAERYSGVQDFLMTGSYTANAVESGLISSFVIYDCLTCKCQLCQVTTG